MAQHYMTFEDRQTIEKMNAGGYTPNEIAEKIGAHLSTIYRELHRGFTGELDGVCRPVYSAQQSQQAYKASLSMRGRNYKYANEQAVGE